MRKLISYVPLPGHLLLLALAIIMRLPALLFPDYYLPEESLFLSCAERIAGDYNLYADAWFEGPPLLIWIYSGFVNLFGGGALTMLRIATAIYIYLFAAYFQGALSIYRINDRRKYVPGVFLVILLSLPWYGLALSPALLSLFPFAYVMFLILRLTQDEVPSRSAIFYAGLLLAGLILIDYTGLVLTLAAFIAYLLLRGVRVPELVTAVIGMGLGLFVVASWLYFHDALGSFLDVGFFTYFRYLFSKAPSPFEPDLGKLFIDIITNWSAYLVLGGLGFFHFRVKLFSYVIIARRLENIILIWLVFGTVIVLFSGSRLHIHDFALIAVPVAFYASKGWSLLKGFIIKISIWVLLIVPALILYLDMISMYQGSWTALPAKYQSSLGLSHIEVDDIEKIRAIPFPEDAKLWVASPKVQLYSMLHLTPATPFLDHRSAFHKITHVNPDLSTGEVTDAYLFKRFAEDMPNVIIDKGDIVPRLKKRFPTLFASFEAQNAGMWTVWIKD